MRSLCVFPLILNFLGFMFRVIGLVDMDSLLIVGNVKSNRLCRVSDDFAAFSSCADCGCSRSDDAAIPAAHFH